MKIPKIILSSEKSYLEDAIRDFIDLVGYKRGKRFMFKVLKEIREALKKRK